CVGQSDHAAKRFWCATGRSSLLDTVDRAEILCVGAGDGLAAVVAFPSLVLRDSVGGFHHWFGNISRIYRRSFCCWFSALGWLFCLRLRALSSTVTWFQLGLRCAHHT